MTISKKHIWMRRKSLIFFFVHKLNNFRRAVFRESNTFVFETKYFSQIAKRRRNSRNRNTISTKWSRLSIAQSAIKKAFEFRRIFIIVDANCQNNYKSLTKERSTQIRAHIDLHENLTIIHRSQIFRWFFLHVDSCFAQTTYKNFQSRCDIAKRAETKFSFNSCQCWKDFNSFRCRIWISQKFEKYFTFFFKIHWRMKWNVKIFLKNFRKKTKWKDKESIAITARKRNEKTSERDRFDIKKSRKSREKYDIQKNRKNRQSIKKSRKNWKKDSIIWSWDREFHEIEDRISLLSFDRETNKHRHRHKHWHKHRDTEAINNDRHNISKIIFFDRWYRWDHRRIKQTRTTNFNTSQRNSHEIVETLKSLISWERFWFSRQKKQQQQRFWSFFSKTQRKSLRETKEKQKKVRFEQRF